MRCFIILALSALCLASTDYVTAPGGYQIPYECVYHVESGSLIVDQGDYLEVLDHHGSLLTTIKPCARQIYTHGSAWKAWSEYYDVSFSRKFNIYNAGHCGLVVLHFRLDCTSSSHFNGYP